jgi:hypothetical protein
MIATCATGLTTKFSDIWNKPKWYWNHTAWLAAAADYTHLSETVRRRGGTKGTSRTGFGARFEVGLQLVADGNKRGN